MTPLFTIFTIIFGIASIAMILIILVQRPQGGGLASAFGGAGGGGTDTVFGGRVGDALSWMTVAAFVLYLGLAISLNLISPTPSAGQTQAPAATQGPGEPPVDDADREPTPANTPAPETTPADGN
jgi:preprotein translocase subunit SecG